MAFVIFLQPSQLFTQSAESSVIFIHYGISKQNTTKTRFLKVVESGSSQSLQEIGGYKHPAGKDFNDVIFRSHSATGLVFGFCTRYQVNVINHFISRWCVFLLNLTILLVPHSLLSILDYIWRKYWRCCEQLSARPAEYLKYVAFSLNLYELEFLWRYNLKTRSSFIIMLLLVVLLKDNSQTWFQFCLSYKMK